MFRFLSLLFFIISLHSFVARSQSNFRFVQSIPVEVNGKTLLNAWAGGLNSAQISTIDLNFDGVEDLIAFDRTANKLFTFLRISNQYVYKPEYESLFPTLTSWVLLRDFNKDGKKDLFTGNISGISVFVNVSSSSAMKWRPFNNGIPLLTIGFSGSINLKVNLTDIPAIDDVDGDGDLDVLNARFVGVGTIEYHQNMSVEKTGKSDSLQLVRVSQEWGGFEECNCSWFDFNNGNCSQPSGGRVQHDAGKSLLTLDVNDDGARDLLFSEQNCTVLYALTNSGTSAAPSMKSFEPYPANNASTLLFPAAYYEDVDFDGVKDLVVSTNIGPSVFSNFDLSQSVWQYKNTGTDLLPQLSFMKTNFLQENMVDVGSYASPAFADFDRDGDLDMFAGYWANADTIASIHQFENTGTFDQPSFKLITTDYLQFSKFGLYNVKIQFTDVNKDGKTDLAFTATDKKSSVSQLYFLYNQGAGAFDFSGQLPVASGFQIDPSENIFLTDIDKDGLIDMLVGRVDGSLQYWRNGGSSSSFFPVQSSTNYLGLGSSITRYSVSTTVADFYQDGKPDLMVGNKGSIVIYPDFQTASNPQADTVFIENTLKNGFENRNLGGSIRLAVADLYFNFSPLVFIGTIAGGLYIIQPEKSGATDEPLFYLWPNPASVVDPFFMRANQSASVEIFNMIGQKLCDPIALEPNSTETISHHLAAGLYVARVAFASRTVSYKFVVR